MIVLSGVHIGFTGFHGKTGEDRFILALKKKDGAKSVAARNTLTHAFSPSERVLVQEPFTLQTPNAKGENPVPYFSVNKMVPEKNGY